MKRSRQAAPTREAPRSATARDPADDASASQDAAAESPESRGGEAPASGGAAQGFAPAASWPWWGHLSASLAIAVVTLCLYAPAVDLGFFPLDDTQYVRANPHIQGVTWQNVRFILTKPYSANYSPMHLLSYLLDHAVGGMRAGVFHFSSNLWAAACGIGVYVCALALLGHPLAALASAEARSGT